MADGWEGQRRHCCPTSEALHSSKKRSSEQLTNVARSCRSGNWRDRNRAHAPSGPALHPPAVHRPTPAQKGNPPPPPPLLTDWHKQIIDIWPVTCQTQRPATGPSTNFATRCQSIIFTFNILLMNPSHVTIIHWPLNCIATNEVAAFVINRVPWREPQPLRPSRLFPFHGQPLHTQSLTRDRPRERGKNPAVGYKAPVASEKGL